MEKQKFNFKELKKNLKFIIPVLIIIILALTFSYVMSNIEYRIDEEDLPVDGTHDMNKLIINELMTNNGGSLIDSKGQLYDWIELYNGKDHAINLTNYALSDNQDKIKWIFPNVTIEANSYLIVYLAGKTEEGLYTNFKLKSAGGEDLILRNKDGKVIDAVTTSSLNKNEVMFRNLDGEWKISPEATPGYDNTEEGLSLYHKEILSLNNDLKINEVLVRNKGNFKTLEGDYSGYIELINTTNHDLKLSDYSVSNDINHPFMWQLPDITLKANDIMVIYTSGLDIINDQEIHANFTLNKEVGEIVLSKNNKVVGLVDYKNLSNGVALININNTYQKSGAISPGYPNTTEGIKQFSEKHLVNPNSLMINEVMSSNFKYLPQNGNQYYDWIELKNNTSSNINLHDYYLTTNDDEPTKWQLPDVTLKPGEYYIVMASGDSNLSNGSYYHTNFNISDVQALYLYKDNDIMDTMFISNIPVGYSLGRGNNNGFYYFSKPTPKTNNGSGLQAVAYIPTVSTNSGVYNNVTEVSVKLEAPGTIYYTLDGSMPTKSSKVYNGPLLLTKTTVIKAISTEADKINSPILTSSYVINENHTFPVLSISLKPSDFSSVIHNVNSIDYEVGAYAELYENGKSFSIPCGLKLFGGSTRFLPKKSFSINFRKEYGASTLNYKVFDNRDFSSFDSLVVRSGSQDYDNAEFRDVLMTSLVDEKTNLDTQAYKTVILYVNGEYWGVYNLREKVGADFIANHYNIDPTYTNIVRIDGDVKSGTSTSYNNLIHYIRNHDLANQVNYNYVKQHIDIDNLIDYWISECWPANWDTLNVRYFQNPAIDDNKWNYIYYDLDTAMHNINHNYYLYMTNPAGMSTFGHTTELLRNLMRSSEFKKTYVERLSYQLTHVWTKDNVLKKIDELYNKFKGEMPRDRERWGMTMHDWEEEVEFLRKFARERPQYMLSTTKSFFNLSNSDMEKYFGDVDA